MTGRLQSNGLATRIFYLCILGIIAVAVLGLATVAPAYAQYLPGDAGTSVNLGGPLGVLVNSIAEIALVVLSGLAIVVARWVKSKFDVDIENGVRAITEKHRDTLHSALSTGINSALVRLGVGDLTALSVDMRNQLVADAVRWARDKGAPEAVEYFRVGEKDLIEMALSELGKRMGAPTIQNVTYSPNYGADSQAR